MKFTIILLITLFTVYYSEAQDSIIKSIRKDAETYIKSEMKSKKVTGLSIAFVRNDSLVWADGFGYSSLVNTKKCSDSTLFRVGSVSKLFTAIAIMQLLETGKISIDVPVSEIIPEFKIGSGDSDISKVTIRRILTHRSGLPSDIFRGLFNPNPDPIDSIIPYLRNETLTNEPGTYWSYSNPGFTLLGYIVQKVSGIPFEEYIDKNILKPLEMNSSSFTLNDANRHLFSDGFEKGKTYKEPPMFELPAGLLHSNAEDMSHFIIMVINSGTYKGRTILKPETMRQMFEVQDPENPFSMSLKMGLCWFVHGNYSEWEFAGGSVEHGGDTYAYHTQLTILPGLKTGAIVMTNSDGGGSAARDITEKVLKLSTEKYDGKKAPDEKNDEIELVKKTEKKVLELYTGEYTIGPDYLKIRAGRNKLLTKQGGLTLCFIPNNKKSLTPAVRLLGIIMIPIKSQQIFFKEIKGKMYMAAISKKDTMLAGVKTEMPPLSDEWKAMAGEYAGEGTHEYSLFKKIKLYDDDGVLKAKCSGWKNGGTFTLFVKNKNEAVVCGIGRQTGATLKITGDKIYFSGIYYKKIK